LGAALPFVRGVVVFLLPAVFARAGLRLAAATFFVAGFFAFVALLAFGAAFFLATGFLAAPVRFFAAAFFLVALAISKLPHAPDSRRCGSH
jgi:hypothetical protein